MSTVFNNSSFLRNFWSFVNKARLLDLARILKFEFFVPGGALVSLWREIPTENLMRNLSKHIFAETFFVGIQNKKCLWGYEDF